MIRITSSLAARLRFDACIASANAYASAVAGIAQYNVSATQYESWHVAYLCREIGQLAASWRAKLVAAAPGTTLSMSSVFTHQSPYVKWTNGSSSHRCELADLLIAVIDRRGIDPKGYAVLIQAKLSTCGSVTLSTPSERTQFDLLTNRPVFNVDAKVSPQKVDLSSYAPDSALLYGMATNAPLSPLGHYPYWHPCWPSTWLVADDLRQCAKQYAVAPADCLPSVLVGMLQGNFGWEFSLPPTGKDWQHFNAVTPRDYWSELINYLLKDTFGKVLSKRHGIAAGQKTRGRDDLLCFASSSENRAMFLDGFYHSRMYSNFGADETISDDWFQISSAQFMDGDGGIGGFDLGESDERHSGPISAVVFEIGRED